MQPTAAPLKHTTSNSSNSSTRQERNTRSNAPIEDSKKTAPSNSENSEEEDVPDPSEPETRQTRNKKRLQDANDTQAGQTVNNDTDRDGEDGEVTRCICGQQEYPSLPIPMPEGNRSHRAKDPWASANDGLPEDAGSMFIQCDNCEVWQHGGCVGIMDEAMSPDKYFCERCRKDLHKVLTGARGQTYSRYLPVYSHSTSKSRRNPSSPREDGKASAASVLSSAAKRRSTMNSRAALEEEEQYLRAIEESKHAGGTNGQRKAKRGRDDSEEGRPDLKRRKTASDSDSPLENASAQPESDPEAPRPRSRAKKVRGTTAQNQRDLEPRLRPEPPSRRKGRVDRRHPDDSEPPEDVTRNGNGNPRPMARARNNVPKASAGTNTPPLQHRKGSKIARRGRAGRNQHTIHKDGETSMDGNMKNSPRISNSRDSDDTLNGDVAAVNALLANGIKPSKPRHMNPNRTSMNDLRKRAAGILEYITRTQAELSGDKTPPSRTGRPGRGVNGASKLSNQVEESAEEKEKVDEGAFKQMSSLQMVEVLTEELIGWQSQHGRFGEKS